MKTRQLRAHLAALKIDAVLDDVVRGYIPTLELLVDEFHEQADARRGDPRYSAERHRSRRGDMFARLRAAVVTLGDVLVELRGDFGSDRRDLPAGNADTLAKLARLRTSAERYRKRAVSGVSP